MLSEINPKLEIPRIKPIHGVLVIILIIGIWSLYNYYQTKKMDSVSAHRKFTVGRITGVDHTIRSSKAVFYSFNADGKEYNGSVNIYRFGREGFIDKKFQVIYDSLDPSNSAMLIFQETFNYFNLSMPDSLSPYNK